MPDLGRTERSTSEAVSVTVLRESGPLDLREITRLTAIRMGWSLMYDDVDAVLRREQDAGRVALVSSAGDYRNQVWKAVP